MREAPRLLLITPERVSGPRIADVVSAGAEVFGAGLLVQARAKSGGVELARVAEAVARACRAAGVPFAVNGDEALARSLGAEAFHAPGSLPLEGLRRRMRSAWISRSAHHDRDVLEAERAGLSAVLVSPVFHVPGKGPSRGLGALRAARALASTVRIVALGGVTPERAASCIEAGADGVAVMRAAFDASRPAAVFRAFDAALGLAPRPPSARAIAMATYDETLTATIELLRRHVDATKSVKPGDHIQNDLGLDSLAVMELVADAEDRFDVSIPNDMLSQLATVDDVAKAVVKLTTTA